MAERSHVSDEPFDVYADQVQITVGPYGSTITFALSPARPPAVGQAPAVREIGSIRLSTEHLKSLAFLAHDQVRRFERNEGVLIPVPRAVLNGQGIGFEDWLKFWE